MAKNREFEAYLFEISSDAFIVDVARRLQHPQNEVQALVYAYANEARFGYTLVQPYLDRSKRLLEVGAGVGILSSYLHLSGYDVLAIEPSGPGFDMCYAIGMEIRRLLGIDEFRFVRLGVEDLHEKSGQFDLIYSINVLEHLSDLNLSFRRMESVLSAQGLMVHTCPNYHVPYEPHFEILLVPCFPRLSEHLLPREITDSVLWRSFNFITSTELKRICRRQGLCIAFESQIMYRSMQRLGNDDIFADRHQGVVKAIFRFLSVTRLIFLLKIWPLILSTPMVFVCNKNK